MTVDPVTQAALEALSRATIRSYSHKQRDLRLDFESNDDLTAVVVMVGHRIASQTVSPVDGGFGATLESVWQQARANHEGYSATGDNEHDIRFFTLGLAGEAGEVANFVKKRWRDGDGHDDDLRKECADVFAYTIMLADSLGMTPQSLLDMVAFKQGVFVEKMRTRTALTDEGSQP